MRFDFLHAARPAVPVSRIALPPHVTNACCALAGAACIVAGAAWIDRVRMLDAQHAEAVYRVRYESAERDAERIHVYYRQVAAWLALDRSVRGIVASGDANARALADIAQQLPPQAWLTSIAVQSGTVEIEGRAESFETVSGVMRGLMRTRQARSPVLTQARAESGSNGARGYVTYAIRVGSGP